MPSFPAHLRRLPVEIRHRRRTAQPRPGDVSERHVAEVSRSRTPGRVSSVLAESNDAERPSTAGDEAGGDLRRPSRRSRRGRPQVGVAVDQQGRDPPAGRDEGEGGRSPRRRRGGDLAAATSPGRCDRGSRGDRGDRHRLGSPGRRPEGPVVGAPHRSRAPHRPARLRHAVPPRGPFPARPAPHRQGRSRLPGPDRSCRPRLTARRRTGRRGGSRRHPPRPDLYHHRPLQTVVRRRRHRSTVPPHQDVQLDLPRRRCDVRDPAPLRPEGVPSTPPPSASMRRRRRIRRIRGPLRTSVGHRDSHPHA